jgi:hypothetical protein
VVAVELLRGVRARSTTDPATTFAMTRGDLEQWRQRFEAPIAEELGAIELDPAPSGFDSWDAWIEQWWPTSLLGP